MRVLIVDDHPLYRAGVRALLSGLEPDLVAIDVSNVAQALALEQEHADQTFDLVLLDMNLPGTSRLDALQQVKSRFESAAVVVVSGDEDPALILAAIDAGAAGFIPKSTDPAITAQALRLVLAHGTYLPPHALRDTRELLPKASSDGAAMPDLSERQRAVLLRLLHGKANKVIARELGIAEGTVKAHLWSVYQLLGVASRAQAMCRVHELGLLDKLR